jgi:ech hydrogenase subunit D
MTQYLESQPITDLPRADLAAKAAQLKQEGWRLVHIACTTQADNLEVIYAFDRDYHYANYRVLVPKADPKLGSITASYLAAFTYENELQDLFGLTVSGLVLDFKGSFYRKAMPKPFNPDPPAAAAPSPGAPK